MKIDYSDISQYNSFPVTEELHQNAYFNWLNAGCPEGRELEFWCEAEREMFGYTADEIDEAYREYRQEQNEDFLSIVDRHTHEQ